MQDNIINELQGALTQMQVTELNSKRDHELPSG